MGPKMVAEDLIERNLNGICMIHCALHVVASIHVNFTLFYLELHLLSQYFCLPYNNLPQEYPLYEAL